jgi:rubrerythrin
MSQMFFNKIEAAKIAQSMEKNGLTFYQKAAAKAKAEGAKALFLQLVEDEKRHLAMFEGLEETLQANRRGAAGYADDDEIAAYIDRLLQTQVFAADGAVARLADEATDDVSAMATAMKAERDAIVFYQEMLDFVDSKDAQETFTIILLEERRHLRLLGEQCEQCA